MIKKFCCSAYLLLHSFTVWGQTPDLVQSDGITSPLHQAHVGEITFMEKVIPVENYTEADFLTTFALKENCDFNIRVFMGNSLTNYLHALAPELSAETLTQKGNYQFTFYIDDILLYRENLPAGAGSPASKNTRTVWRVPLLSTTNEDSWGRFLWNRFILRGGEEALTAGTHTLKIEIRPYLQLAALKVGELIAQGQIQITIAQPQIDEQQIAIQPIKPHSGWPISTASYDHDKIRELNRKIAERAFKDLTSLVVIKDGKLWLEEYFNGATRHSLHDTRSVGKTFASALTGIAIHDGHLEGVQQTLKEFYPLHTFAHYSAKKDSVTLQSLLTMSSAFAGSDNDDASPGNEEKMYPTDNWVKFALDLPMDEAKKSGQQWDYFTAGVVLLGDILHQSVPGGLEKYAEQKLFRPLGIQKYVWQYTPQKVANTAGGLQLTALDYAKFGQLYLNRGVWNGQQILPSDWVAASLSKQIGLPFAADEFYGYLFWNKTYTVGDKAYETFYCSGNGGNKIFLFKELGLVVVITATAYNKPYAHPQVDKLMIRYLLPAMVK